MTHLWLTTTTGNVENTELHHDKCHNAEQAGARAAKTRVIQGSQHLPELPVIQERLLRTEVPPNGVFKFGNRQPEEKARSM